MNAAQDAIAATVENGGGTFYADTLLPLELPRGYVVAMGGVTMDPAKVTDETLLTWARRVAQEWESGLVGTWLDNGIFYLDAVRIYSWDRRKAALDDARRWGQLAIYDFATGESIAVPTEQEVA